MNTPVRVAQFGAGEWGMRQWLAVMLPLLEWGVIHCTVVDQADEPPREIAGLVENGSLTYLSWKHFLAAETPFDWEVAFVVTPADQLIPVCWALLKSAPRLNRIVLEKPWGSTRKDLETFTAAARKQEVEVFGADHYLLRAAFLVLLAQDRDILRSLGQILEISCCLKETKADGPRCNSVVADLGVHLINMIGRALFPNSRFEPSTVLVCRASNAAEWQEDTYADIHGVLVTPDSGSIPCRLECGKSMPEDDKSLRITGTCGTVVLNLQRNTVKLTTINGKEETRTCKNTWSYGSPILWVLFGI